MRNPNLVPWDYPEYFAMLHANREDSQEDDVDYDFPSDYEENDSCGQCKGHGCSVCLMTEW